MVITERKIKYLEAGKSRQIVWDNGGFGIQVSPDGEKSFVLEYRFNWIDGRRADRCHRYR